MTSRSMALLMLSLFTPTLAWGFAAAGHEAVCEIAYRELNPTAKAAVDRLMAAETDERFKTFRQSCVWPDHPSALTNGRRPEHFINVPRDWTDIAEEKCVAVETCLFTAISKDLKTVARRNKPIAQRLIALKFLGHWIGDLHQPLHVSFEDDRGGNQVLLETGMGCDRNLHSVWDKCIPQDLMQAMGVGENREAFGKELQESITASQRAAWTADLSPLKWARESLAIARSPEVEYCQLQGTTCRYSDETVEFVPEEFDAIELALTPAYEDQFGDEVAERIKQAGVRLGALLNRAFPET